MDSTDKNSAILYLAEEAVPLRGSPRWVLAEGSDSPDIVFSVSADYVESVLKPQAIGEDTSMANIPAHLVMTDVITGVRNVYEGIFLTTVRPTDNINEWEVTAGDQRIYWPRKHVKRWFNMRRTVGYWRMTTPGASEKQNVTEDKWYWRWSLKDHVIGSSAIGVPWTTYDIAEWLMNYTWEYVKTFWPNCPQPKIQQKAGDNAINPQDFVFDDDLAACWNRLLAYDTKLKIWLNRQGRLYVGVREPSQDGEMLERAKPFIFDGGFIDKDYKAHERPRWVDVYFTNEHEVRFDYEEPRTWNRSAIASQAEDRQLVNVLRVPDFTLGNYVQGDWISFDSALRLFSEDTPDDVTIPIDWDVLRAMMVPYLDLASVYRLVGAQATNADWPSRIDAIQRCFRKTYKIPRDWMDSTIEIVAARVALANYETGDQPNSTVYSDYFRVYGRRNHLRRWLQFGLSGFDYGRNVQCYPPTGQLDTRDFVREAPATVTILNHDIGIINLTWEIDPLRTNEQVLPGTLNESTAPSGNLRGDGSVTFDSVVSANRSMALFPHMDTGYKMCLILTCVPAAGELFKVRIRPSQVFNEVDGCSSQFLGPPVEVRIGKTTETARWAWRDQDARAICGAFGLVRGGVAPPPIELLMNYRGSDDVPNVEGGASLVDIAKAAAARVYWKFQDRNVGSAEFQGNAELMPAGFIESIENRYGFRGEITSKIKYPDDIPELRLESLMADDTRAIIQRQARRGTAGPT